jgi:hypothetical protein
LKERYLARVRPGFQAPGWLGGDLRGIDSRLSWYDGQVHGMRW